MMWVKGVAQTLQWKGAQQCISPLSRPLSDSSSSGLSAVSHLIHLEAEVVLKSSLSHSLPFLGGHFKAERCVFSLVPVQETPFSPGVLHHTPDICPKSVFWTAKASPATGLSPLLAFSKANTGCFSYCGILPWSLMLLPCFSQRATFGSDPEPRSPDVQCHVLQLIII